MLLICLKSFLGNFVAINPWTANQLDAFADEFALISQKLRDGAALMREKKLPQVYLNADTAFGMYRESIARTASILDGDVRNQATAIAMNVEPAWVVNQRKNAKASAPKVPRAIGDLDHNTMVKQPAKKPRKKTDKQ